MGRAKALLWDNDGILVDTEPLYMGVTREIMAEVGVGLSIDEFREVSLERGQSCFELVRAAGFEQEKFWAPQASSEKNPQTPFFQVAPRASSEKKK